MHHASNICRKDSHNSFQRCIMRSLQVMKDEVFISANSESSFDGQELARPVAHEEDQETTGLVKPNEA